MTKPLIGILVFYIYSFKCNNSQICNIPNLIGKEWNSKEVVSLIESMNDTPLITNGTTFYYFQNDGLMLYRSKNSELVGATIYLDSFLKDGIFMQPFKELCLPFGLNGKENISELTKKLSTLERLQSTFNSAGNTFIIVYSYDDSKDMQIIGYAEDEQLNGLKIVRIQFYKRLY